MDLLLIYPLLFGVYVVSLWPRLRHGSIFAAAALMAINAAFFALSYRWFGKNPG